MKFFSTLCIAFAALCVNTALLAAPQFSQQLLFVVGISGKESQGFLQRYERPRYHKHWRKIGKKIPVTLGAKGFAWDPELKREWNLTGVEKTEGDGKSPAGIFSLEAIFGFDSPSRIPNLKMPYLPVTPHMVCVDDPDSEFYNQIVPTPPRTTAWKSAERMHNYPVYRYGAVVNYNHIHVHDAKHPLKQSENKTRSGSCIFLHLTSKRIPKNHAGHRSTAGCTAMKESDLLTVLSWLDNTKHPRLVQSGSNQLSMLTPILKAELNFSAE